MQQLATLVLLSATISATANSGQAPMNHINSGGDTTIHSSNRQAFSQPASNMPLMKKMDFHVGNSFFRNPWVAAPASTTARDGLGPLFNTNGCQNCHIRDGRGHAPGKNDLNAVSMLVRLSIPATTEKMEQQLITDGAIAEPVYGGQLQDFAIPGVRPEGQIDIHYSTIIKAFSDGETIELRKPTVKLHQLNYGELHANVMTSARIAPAMIGLGLLQAVDEQTLLALADEQDANGDGISGRINRVWDIEQQKTVVGRFGWKAGQPSLKQQNAAAFSGDMGLTTSLFPTENCTATQQTICSAVPNGGQPEVSDNILDHVTFYSHNLAVPARRNHSDPDVKLGEKLFANAGCHNCHIDQMTTGESQFAWLSGQKIAPYTDLLLHDMGEGLADNRPEFMATGREWRTAPLWGIGLTKTVAGEMNFLHDGRARNLMEAVLWHGGEAEAATDAVLNMNSQERHALIQFLQSL
ncbi:MAG: c-type cytochrome [Pseudomonadales bacterium]|nr:c-type cytochrome [Pseudomonadales bacterium]MCP5301935.1 c-type cytochrome [Pseudomonadales bacterium]